MSEKILNSRITLKHDTTANWATQGSFIPKAGEIVIYDDYETEQVGTETVKYPNFKIGDGVVRIADLPFVNSNVKAEIEQHMADTSAHVSSTDRAFWNAKVRTEDDIVNETLTFTTL